MSQKHPSYDIGAVVCVRTYHALWVGLECDLGAASRTSDVEAEDGDGVIFLIRRFFPSVELATFVDELSTARAFHAEGRHQSDGLLLRTGLFGTSSTLDLARIEIRRIIFREHFSFRHAGGSCAFPSRVVCK